MKDQEACPLRYQGKRPLMNEDKKSDCDYPYCPALWDPSSLLAKPLHVSEDPLFSSCPLPEKPAFSACHLLSSLQHSLSMGDTVGESQVEATKSHLNPKKGKMVPPFLPSLPPSCLFSVQRI